MGMRQMVRKDFGHDDGDDDDDNGGFGDDDDDDDDDDFLYMVLGFVVPPL